MTSSSNSQATFGRAGKRVALGAFFGALWLPLLLGLSQGSVEVSEAERRELAPLPALETLGDLARFPEAAATWYDDHLGLRAQLIEWNARVRVRGLGVAPSPGIVVGRDGWLFRGDRNADQLAGTRFFSEAQLRQWAEILEERRRWVESQGIAYLLVLVPLKGVIYPEYLPRSLVRERNRTTFEVLGAYLARETRLDPLRLDEVLRAAKREGASRLYHKTDLHWNDRGAYVAYRAILERLSARLPALAGDVAVGVGERVLSTPGLDLAALWGLASIFPEQQVLLEVKGARSRSSAQSTGALAEARRGQRDLRVGTGDVTDPVAIVFRDSFATALVPFLAEHFREVTFSWNRDVDPSAVLRIRPDVVIHEIWEGTVAGMRWGPPKHAQWRTPIRPDGV